MNTLLLIWFAGCGIGLLIWLLCRASDRLFAPRPPPVEQPCYEPPVPQPEDIARRQATEDARRRREEARVAVELFYTLHAPEIAQRFSRAQFDQYVGRFLSDQHPPEYVEERSRQLQEIIRTHLERVEPPKKKRTVEELAAWYATMRETIERQPIDDRQKRVQLAQLNLRYRDLINDVMETLEP